MGARVYMRDSAALMVRLASVVKANVLRTRKCVAPTGVFAQSQVNRRVTNLSSALFLDVGIDLIENIKLFLFTPR